MHRVLPSLVAENYRQNEAKLKTAFEQRTVALQQADEVWCSLPWARDIMLGSVMRP